MSRPVHKYATVAVGSNTTIKTGSGTLYGVVVTPGTGGQVHLVDSVSIGTNPPLITAVTGDMVWIGPYVDAEPEAYRFGLGFNDGLTIAATSNTRVNVEYE